MNEKRVELSKKSFRFMHRFVLKHTFWGFDSHISISISIKPFPVLSFIKETN